MKASLAAYSIIKHFEQCCLKAYPDPASPLAAAWRLGKTTGGLSGAPWTIGFGETGDHVHEGMIWTSMQANEALEKRVAQFEADVSWLIGNHLAPQCQFDALVSFAYNVGSDIDQDSIPEGLGDSTLMRLLLAGNDIGAANEFLKWNRAGGAIMHGLTKRRTAERALFLGASVEEALRIGERAPRF